MDDVAETAWAAGLFEGEGSLTLRKNMRAAVMMLSMTDQDVVARFHQWAGCGSVTLRKKGAEHHKQAWCWQTGNGADIVRLAGALRPHMGLRRGDKIDQVVRVLSPRIGLCKNMLHPMPEGGRCPDCRSDNYRRKSVRKQGCSPASSK